MKDRSGRPDYRKNGARSRCCRLPDQQYQESDIARRFRIKTSSAVNGALKTPFSISRYA
ncbi:hypothetical protein [Aquibium oceanicum]|uniref:hypothetical protein n=1 Tax=Aquibium oceanicum TaxID=1670800 RepID=UPI000A553693|nr:hypothetical protein [Aquibium oceanicum]